MDKNQVVPTMEDLFRGTFLEEIFLCEPKIEPPQEIDPKKEKDLGMMKELESRLFTLSSLNLKASDILTAQLRYSPPQGDELEQMKLKEQSSFRLGKLYRKMLWAAIRERLNVPDGYNVGVRRSFIVVMFKEEDNLGIPAPLRGLFDQIKKGSHGNIGFIDLSKPKED